jgi:NAD(P)-dependent dehydrogenase (short-subunit alcohol dehydrogenase family)
MDANLLKGQRVVVVGASSGIGLAAAQQAATAGADVVMVSRSIDKLRQAAAVVQGSPELVALDMLDARGVGETFAKLGPVDHLVLTAVADENKRRSPVHELTDEQFERSMDKLRGFFHVVRAVVPTITQRGSIVLTSGGSALKPPRQGMSVLAAVNASVIAFGHALALELSPRRVNVVTPGVVDTSVWAPADRERIRAWAESPDLPAQRFGQPADIAQAMLLLLIRHYLT